MLKSHNKACICIRLKMMLIRVVTVWSKFRGKNWAIWRGCFQGLADSIRRSYQWRVLKNIFQQNIERVKNLGAIYQAIKYPTTRYFRLKWYFKGLICNVGKCFRSFYSWNWQNLGCLKPYNPRGKIPKPVLRDLNLSLGIKEILFKKRFWKWK